MIRPLRMVCAVTLGLLLHSAAAYGFDHAGTAGSGFAAACATPISTPLMLLGLIAPASVEPLRTIAERTDHAAYAPVRISHTLYDRPSGQPIATLLIAIDPDDGISAGLAIVGQPLQPFRPLVFDPDLFYGPWFHVTLIDRLGPWSEIVIPPLGPVWLSAEGLPMVSLHDVGASYLLDGAPVRVTRWDGERLWFRDGADDDGCAIPAEIVPASEDRSTPASALYEPGCIVRLVPRYLRGC